MTLLARCVPAFPAGLEQDTALLASVWRRWRKTPRHGCEAPFFHVCFYENESHLSKIDMDCARSVGTDGWKEVLRFKSMGDVIELFAIAGEKYGAAPRPVSNTDNITLDILRTVGSWGEWLIETTVARRNVGNGRFVVSWYCQ
jgi:hypothetical protein